MGMRLRTLEAVDESHDAEHETTTPQAKSNRDNDCGKPRCRRQSTARWKQQVEERLIRMELGELGIRANNQRQEEMMYARPAWFCSDQCRLVQIPYGVLCHVQSSILIFALPAHECGKDFRQSC
jgi:hypothetical protein